MDPRNEISPQMDHYIGIDVGTGSARACIIDSRGDIVGLASENIGLWQPEQGFYVRILVFLPDTIMLYLLLSITIICSISYGLMTFHN